MALPANQLAGRIPDSYIHMWAASLLRGEGTIVLKTIWVCPIVVNM